MSAGKYLYAIYSTTCYLKMVGDMKYTECAALDELLDDIFKDNVCKEMIIDLSDTDWLDSTNLGLLAKISRYSLKNHQAKPLLFSQKEDINQLLDNMGFGNFFQIIDKIDESQLQLQELNEVHKCRQSMKKIMLDAHENLIEMNSENKEKFKNVIDVLRSSLS